MSDPVSAQLSIVPAITPDDLIRQACAQFEPVASYCLFSGGNDSSVLAHRCRDYYDALCFIDTGTAIDGVERFVSEFAEWIGKPLVIYRSGDAFRRLVLEHGGFPGPAGHGRAYTRLKERQIEALVRDSKVGCHRNSKVMLLTGKRKAESARRAKTTKGVEAKGGQLYVNPLLDWDAGMMWTYRREHRIPESPVAAVLHMSGECGCGAFGGRDEFRFRCQMFPEWGEPMKQLEREAEALGVVSCRWGGFDKDLRPISGERTEGGALCSSCDFRYQLSLEQAA